MGEKANQGSIKEHRAVTISAEQLPARWAPKRAAGRGLKVFSEMNDSLK